MLPHCMGIEGKSYKESSCRGGIKLHGVALLIKVICCNTPGKIQVRLLLHLPPAGTLLLVSVDARTRVYSYTNHMAVYSGGTFHAVLAHALWFSLADTRQLSQK